VVRAERTGSPLVASLVDADGDGTYSSLAIVGGQPAIAYYEGNGAELRFAQRSGGTWSDVLIDADGGGVSNNVGQWVSLAVLDNGEPAVASDAPATEEQTAAGDVGEAPAAATVVAAAVVASSAEDFAVPPLAKLPTFAPHAQRTNPHPANRRQPFLELGYELRETLGEGEFGASCFLAVTGGHSHSHD